MSDIFAQVNELRQDDLRQHLPEQSRLARFEVGQAVLDWLKATARPEGAPPENPWRPDGWTPPPGISSLFGVPVMLSDGLEPGAWRAIDRDGEAIKEGRIS